MSSEENGGTAAARPSRTRMRSGGLISGPETGWSANLQQDHVAGALAECAGSGQVARLGAQDLRRSCGSPIHVDLR